MFLYNGNPNCRVQVNFCYDIDVYGFVTIELCNFNILDPSCFSSITLDDLWDQVYSSLFNYIENIPTHYYPDCDSLSPQMFNTEVKKAVCWNRVEFVDRYEYWPCDLEPGLCTRDYIVCKENGQLKFIAGDTELVDEGDCDTPPNIYLPPNSGCYNFCGW